GGVLDLLVVDIVVGGEGNIARRGVGAPQQAFDQWMCARPIRPILRRKVGVHGETAESEMAERQAALDLPAIETRDGLGRAFEKALDAVGFEIEFGKRGSSGLHEPLTQAWIEHAE